MYIMDIYVQIKNKKGEIFKVVNLGREEYLHFFKRKLKKLKENKSIEIFLNEFEPGKYIDIKKVKILKEEAKIIAGIIGKELYNYKEFIRRRTILENEIINSSYLKNLMVIGISRLKEMMAEGKTATAISHAEDKKEIKSQLASIRKEIGKLSESERLLEEERKNFQAVFDIESLFDILSESIGSSSGIYIRN